MDACLEKQWDEAAAYHKKLRRWELDHVSVLSRLGHRHAVIAVALMGLTKFLICERFTRPPYYPVDAEVCNTLQKAFLTYWSDELDREPLLKR